MKLHWSPRSPYVRKALLAAHECGVADQIERRRTPVAMSTSNADLLSDNPLNKIPTLVLDDGLAIFDSYALCEYFDELAGGDRIIPAHGRDRILAQRFHALGHGLIDNLILARNERDRPEGQRSMAHIDAFALKRRATLALLENEIESFTNMAFGIGQIAIGCALSYADFRFAAEPWRDSAPKLAKWYEGFEARPSALSTRLADG